ncbi:hypothetical protein KIN20_009213 [Parelaphostrongylus tenuis]|uniref:Uncharacterized protein n=1 Tax=Parelaphostrongylus tenuis TaxID=148309 RepID=A0AAD5MRI5_PARTN|nr:hypothetical protein KIN20_009213 [Parelaphostrongylus tenuis]
MTININNGRCNKTGLMEQVVKAYAFYHSTTFPDTTQKVKPASEVDSGDVMSKKASIR